MAVNYHGKKFYNIGPWCGIHKTSHDNLTNNLEVSRLPPSVPSGANVIKLFTAVIYCHSMVIPSFCVIKLYYLGNYHGIAVNYHGIKSVSYTHLTLPTIYSV